MINRYSSRREKLDNSFLTKKLSGARSYDRIAGYFSSSILEVAGEAIENVSGKVRIVCNSGVTREEVQTAKAAQMAQRREWGNSKLEDKCNGLAGRLTKLYQLLSSGKLEVRVAPDDVFGLVHGKAGVITLADGSQTSFLGSVNETGAGWRLNYELMWEDDSLEAVAWVQQEFEYFWNSPYAVPLSDFVVQDIERLSRRQIVPSIDDWREKPDPAGVVVEAPVYRQELGLWEYQKAFIEQAFHDHRLYGGARYVLADQVGLGKTVQLAMSAQLMALYGDKPVLVIVPKTLISQWQEELMSLLLVPSAVWTGKNWHDEQGIDWPDADISHCPRRIGIISQSLIVNAKEEYQEQLLKQCYECVIVDEAHRARRIKYKDKHDWRFDRRNANKLMDFLLKISPRTKSMLLATATPVQMHPIEAWDLLNILSQGNMSVLGSHNSPWRIHRSQGLALISGEDHLPTSSVLECCEWLRDPFPPREEDKQNFGRLRDELRLSDNEFYVSPSKMLDLIDSPACKRRIIRMMTDNFIEQHNPFIRHIVRRSREFLENNGQLPKIEVVLMGEDRAETIPLYNYLQQAYNLSEKFCHSLGRRVRGGGFIKTMLLKRMGSTMIAGRRTAEKMLHWDEPEAADYLLLEEDDAQASQADVSECKQLTSEEKDWLQELIEILKNHEDDDPKYEKLINILQEKEFARLGCIIFSQYYDSAYWVAEKLSREAYFNTWSIGLYAGGDKSGVFKEGIFQKCTKDELKTAVRQRKIKILIGTDAASEGLNLQSLGSLINLDLPWNPTRLEQRKGRIQRIGQLHDKIFIYNMRYRDSVEDRVHEMLSKRLQEINRIFGQLPDVLDDVWIDVALAKEEEARLLIDSVPNKHPFTIKYEAQTVEHVDWESCAKVLDNQEKRRLLMQSWH